MTAIWCEIKIKLILYRKIMVLNRVQFETHGSVCPIVTLIKGRNYDFQTGRGLGDFGYPVTLPMRRNDRRAVQNGRT
jgi:hypothetical protein